MKNRFETLKRSNSNLYVEESPVIISEGALLKDTLTESIIIQMKFQSVTEREIKALFIRFKTYDIAGTQLGNCIDFQYLDLSIHNGSYFGDKKAIIAPEKTTRDFKVEEITVVFADEETVVINGSLFKPLPELEQLTCVLSNEEILKQYRLETTSKSKYVPINNDTIWCCTCGKWNASLVCSACACSRDVVFSKYNPTDLERKAADRLEEEEKRIAESREKAKAANIAKQKKLKKYSIILISLFLIISLTTLVITKSIQKKNYNLICSYISQKKYELAFDTCNTKSLNKKLKKELIQNLKENLNDQRHCRVSNTDDVLALNVDNKEFYATRFEFYSKNNENEIIMYYEIDESERYLEWWEDNGTVRDINNDFMYGNGYILFSTQDTNKIDGHVSFGCDYIYCLNVDNSNVSYVASVSNADFWKLDNGNIVIADGYKYILFNPYEYSFRENIDKETAFGNHEIIYTTEETEWDW